MKLTLTFDQGPLRGEVTIERPQLGRADFQMLLHFANASKESSPTVVRLLALRPEADGQVHKLKAIKQLREVLPNYGLMDAKTAVERVMDGRPTVLPSQGNDKNLTLCKALKAMGHEADIGTGFGNSP